MKKWLKGDTHFHTNNSDGKYTFEKLVSMCQKRGLDFMMITDHNFYTASKSFYHKNMLVIPGWEYTGSEGHVNFWGSNLPEVPKDAPKDIHLPVAYERYVDEADKVNQAGGCVSINHPFCKKCGWKMDLDNFKMDSAEVWNAPMHIDNVTNVEWWHKQLLKGRRLTAVGGSDYHNDYVVTKLIACPTTYVCCEENTEESVLENIKKGHAFITNTPTSTELYLTCGDKITGDEVDWSEGIKSEIKALKLKKNHTLKIWNNDKVIYEYTASKKTNHTAEFEVKEKGFIRAEVIYTYGKVGKFLYGKLAPMIVPGDKGLEIPPFIYAMTNPIYFK